MPFDSFDGYDSEDGEFMQSYISFIQSNSNFDDSFIKKKEKKDTTSKDAQSLEVFIENEEVKDENSSNN